MCTVNIENLIDKWALKYTAKTPPFIVSRIKELENVLYLKCQISDFLVVGYKNLLNKIEDSDAFYSSLGYPNIFKDTSSTVAVAQQYLSVEAL